MSDPNIQVVLEHAAHELLMWTGFGTLVGLAAKAIMPGRDPGGAIGTLMM
ncbi:MAG: GlsB/YeaQ/YmgE family stress response membrane protein, partial [Planctomycetes bacterium]|nr:GlsB/YeaQ/YmgE family stress response membrane protein [Planctomycetota bacterium]